jgi:hypothetical protein
VGHTSVQLLAEPDVSLIGRSWIVTNPYTPQAEVRKITGIENRTASFATGLVYQIADGTPAIISDDIVLSVLLFGAYGDGTHATETTAAIQSAVDALIALGSGGTVYFPAGIYAVNSQIEVDGHNIHLAGQDWGGGSGSELHGSIILVGGDIAGDIIVFGSSTTTYGGCGIRDIGFEDIVTPGVGITSRNYAVSGAALHVRRTARFDLKNVDFRSIRGTALKTTQCIFGQFENILIEQCGATGQPAFEMPDTSGSDITQQCVFVGVRIEVTCGGADSLAINDTLHGGNKFFGCGFETDACTSSQGVETTDGVFLRDLGRYNSFTNFHFNRQGQGGVNPKVYISGDDNIYSNWIFDGDRPAANIYLTGAQSSIFSNIRDSGDADNTARWMIEMAGACLYNTFIGIYGYSTSGILVGASCAYNEINARFRGGSEKALDCIGTNNKIRIYLTGFTTDTTLVEVSGDNNDVYVEADTNSSCATEVVLVSGLRSNILPGSRIRSSVLAHGIRITGNSGIFNNIHLTSIGKHGIFVDGLQPSEICNNLIELCGLAAAATYNGISLEAGSDKTTGGVCNGNRITGANHAFSIFVTDNGGAPRYDYWTFVGNNVRSGGALSISVGNNIIEHNRT